MESLASSVGSQQFLDSHHLKNTCSLKSFGCAALIVASLSALVIAAVGVGGYFQVGSLSNLSQVHSITLMAIGGGGGLVFLALGSVQVAKNLGKAQKEEIKKPSALKPNDPATSISCSLETPTPAETPFVMASDGINQYKAGGPAACTRIACRFLALTPGSPVCSEDIDHAIQKHGYSSAEFEDTDEIIAEFSEQLEVLPNPWFEHQYSPEMQVNINGLTTYGIREALTYLFNNPDVNGAIVTGQMMTLAMRKEGGEIELFDSHGSNELTGSKDNRAYAIRCDLAGAIHFLSRRFPKFEGSEDDDPYGTIVFYPLKIRPFIRPE